MDPQSLALFVEIVEAGNLSEAARRLKMTRANVSYHLAQLERAAGMQLLRRTTRRIEPTEIGLRLVAHGQAIRDALDAARESVALLGQTLQGRVRLSVPSGYGQLVMADWLIDFKRAHPGIVLEVVFENRVEDLLRDEVDIAVRVITEPPDNLVARDLGAVRYVACASASYAERRGLPSTLAALRDAPVLTSGVIGRPLRLSAYPDGQDQRREEVLLEPTLASENFVFLREAILGGLGVGLVPDYVVREDVAQGRIRTTLDAWRLSIFGSRMFMLYMPNRHHTRAARTLIEFVLERAAAQTSGTASTATAPGFDAV